MSDKIREENVKEIGARLEGPNSRTVLRIVRSNDGKPRLEFRRQYRKDTDGEWLSGQCEGFDAKAFEFMMSFTIAISRELGLKETVVKTITVKDSALNDIVLKFVSRNGGPLKLAYRTLIWNEDIDEFCTVGNSNIDAAGFENLICTHPAIAKGHERCMQVLVDRQDEIRKTFTQFALEERNRINEDEDNEEKT